MAVTFNIDCAITNYGDKGNNDLRKILTQITKEPLITDTKQAAYVLATFAIESYYTASTVESYWLIKDGLPPCQTKSEKFIRWGKSKKNYNGPRCPNGVPMYIGRGLIQITHEYNYKTYSKVVPGLLENPDLALIFENAWAIAMEYLRTHKTLKLVLENNLTKARKTVNGGTNGINAVNKTYNKWLNTLIHCGASATSGGTPIVPVVIASNDTGGVGTPTEAQSGVGTSTEAQTIQQEQVNRQAIVERLQNMSGKVLTPEKASEEVFKPKTSGETEQSPTTGYEREIIRT